MDSIVGLIIWLSSVFAAGVIGRLRGRWGLGIVLGMLLAPVGVLIIALIPTNYDNQARQEAKARERDELERQLLEAARQRPRP